MFVLVACEESQTVCKAFRDLGHYAFSCDIQHSSGGYPEWHIQQNVLDILECSSGCNIIDFICEDGHYDFVPKWDLIIAHPPCTMLCRTSSVALSLGQHTANDVRLAREFFMRFYNLENVRVCIENPVPMAFANLPKWSQCIQPYEYGDNWTKLTCLWLKNLPPLIPQCYGICSGNSRNSAPSFVYHKCGIKARSKTFNGIARAMAKQWGSF